MFRGWLDGDTSNAENDVSLLEYLGVKILDKQDFGVITTYAVKMDGRTLMELDKHWGRFCWGLGRT